MPAQRRWWPIYALSCAAFGFLWAITLLTYLLPPATVWGNLLHGSLIALRRGKKSWHLTRWK